MALYSSETSLDCHRVRFVLAEKGINVDIVNVSVDESAAADLAELLGDHRQHVARFLIMR